MSAMAIELAGAAQVRKPSTRYQWLLELILYVYFIFSAFSHLWFYVPNLSSVIFANIALLVVVYDPIRIRWCFLPFLSVVSMLVIDMTGYALDLMTLNDYVYWMVMFAVFLVLHRDPRFFERGKVFLVILLGLHMLFLEQDEGGALYPQSRSTIGIMEFQ